MANSYRPNLPERCPSCAYLGEVEEDERVWGKEGALGRIHCHHCKAHFCPDCWNNCTGCGRSANPSVHDCNGCPHKCCGFCGGTRTSLETRKAADGDRGFTIRELQTKLPWTIHYHRDFRASPMAHKDFAHALLHVQKACGKLAAVVNDAEHKGSEFTPDEVDCYVADLVVCALRMANTCPGRTIDLQKAVVDRIEGKNGMKLER